MQHRERDEGHEPVDHGELTRDPGGDVGVGLGDPRVVLAQGRLRAGDRAKQIGPEPIALGRSAADRQQRRSPLDGRPDRAQKLEGLGRLRTVDDDRAALGDVGRRPARDHEADLAEPLGQGAESGATTLGEARRQDEDDHG